MKPKLLAIDQDPATLTQIAEVAATWFDTIRLRDTSRVNEILDSHSDAVAVVLVEHVASLSGGVALLEGVRLSHPGIRRILVATFCDLGSIIGGLHSGAIQGMLHKPFRKEELAAVIRPHNAAAYMNAVA